MAAPSFRTPLLWLLLPMIGGYSIGHLLPELPVLPLTVFAAICLGGALFTSVQEAKAWHSNAWALFLILGVSSASLLYYQNHRHYPDLWEQLPPREANLQLKVLRLYNSQYEDLITGIAEVKNTETHLNSLKGHSIYFSVLAKHYEIHRGQTLRTRGVLTYLPAKSSLSLFETYLQGQSVALVMNRAFLMEAPEDGSALERLINSMRIYAINTLGIQLDKYPDERAVYRGMMLGLKGELSAENKQLFLKTGTLHLFAISGLHVGIIAVTWAGIFLVLRVPKQLSVIIGLALVYLYVEITGASPSAVRAFAMTAFFWAGKSLVRQMPPFQALVASAITVLLFSPSQLFSAGFQLSYTVVSGILLWGIPLYESLRDMRNLRMQLKEQHLSKIARWWKRSWELVTGTLCISFSATLASAPLSIQYFGILAPVAIVLNMFLVPIASLVIISGLFSLISGFLHLSWLSSFFNHGPVLLIQLTSRLLEWVVQIPGAFVLMDWADDRLAYTTAALFLGSLLVGHAFRLRKRWRFSFPFAITAGMILLNALIHLF